MNTVTVVLSSEAQAANRQAQRDLAELLPLMDKARECGVDVSGYEAIAEGLKNQLTAIERHFMSPPKLGG